MATSRKIKVLIAKPGLDGHDVGAKVVARHLMEAGFDVVYTGLRKSAEQIIERTKEVKPDVIGLSVLSGSHLPFCERFAELRAEHGLDKTLWVVGGVIPEADEPALKALGVDIVFPVGTPLESLSALIREKIS